MQVRESMTYHAEDRLLHVRHKRSLNIRASGHFAGRRLRTEIERCKTCGGHLLSVIQFDVARGEK